METISYRALLADGLWHNNVIFTQLLALCPLMAVTTTATNGLGMGLVTAAVAYRVLPETRRADSVPITPDVAA